MSKHYIPDGNGGFTESVGTGFEGFGVMVFVILAILAAPFLLGQLCSMAIFTAITGGATSVPVTDAILIYTIETILFLSITLIPYLLLFKKMPLAIKICCGFLIVSLATGPFVSLQSSYSGQISGYNIPVQIYSIKENYNPIFNTPPNVGQWAPEEGISSYYCWTEINVNMGGQSIQREEDPCSRDNNSKYSKWTKYSVKNLGPSNLNIFLRYFHSFCFTDKNTTEFELASGQEKTFFCVDQIIRGGDPGWEILNSCIAVSPLYSNANSNYRKLCSDNNWK